MNGFRAHGTVGKDILLAVQDLTGPGHVVGKQIRWNLQTTGCHHVPGAVRLVSEAVGAPHQIGDAWHIRHVTAKEGTFCEFFALCHFDLSDSVLRNKADFCDLSHKRRARVLND